MCNSHRTLLEDGIHLQGWWVDCLLVLHGRSSVQGLLKVCYSILTLVRGHGWRCKICTLKASAIFFMSQLLCPSLCIISWRRHHQRQLVTYIGLTRQFHVKPLLFLLYSRLSFQVWSCHTQDKWSFKILDRNISQLLLTGINRTQKKKLFFLMHLAVWLADFQNSLSYKC